MKTFAINTLGCKVNQYESQQLRELLEGFGLLEAQKPREKPDLVIVNTCCVTHTASAKSRQCIRKSQKHSPVAAIVVVGCLPSVESSELRGLGPNIHFVRNRDLLAATLSNIIDSVSQQESTPQTQLWQPCLDTYIKAKIASKIKGKNELGQTQLPPLRSFKGHTRAFLKVQDGCDGNCTYCIIPKARPVLFSKNAENAVLEARSLVEAGHKEIVVTGVFLGAYGLSSVRRRGWARPENDALAELLEKLAEIPGLARIRLSSLEPGDVTERLIDAFCRYPNIMPHLHLSLQSGSDAVLKRMCRQYRSDGFRKTVEAIKRRLDRPAITTDIIVGFPGETDADFKETVALAREVGFAKIHVFAFSAREGTAAARLQGTVNNEVMKERSAILRELDKKLGTEFREQFIGEEAAVLVEDSAGEPRGRSERYFFVFLKKSGKFVKKNELLRVRLTGNCGQGAVGEAVSVVQQ
jgi:threonylcarbamoyladenosine tRNA methylthiotransferase MtaB